MPFEGSEALVTRLNNLTGINSGDDNINNALDEVWNIESTVSGEQLSQFQRDLLNDPRIQEAIPQLAIEYAELNMKSLDKGGEKGIGIDELDQAYASADTSLERELVNYLKQRFDDIKGVDSDDDGGFLGVNKHNAGGITFSDVRPLRKSLLEDRYDTLSQKELELLHGIGNEISKSQLEERRDQYAEGSEERAIVDGIISRFDDIRDLDTGDYTSIIIVHGKSMPPVSNSADITADDLNRIEEMRQRLIKWGLTGNVRPPES